MGKKAVSTFLSGQPRIEQVVAEHVELPWPFEAVAGRFSGQAGTVLLLSGGRHDCSRFHILGIRPWLSLTGRGSRLRIVAGSKALEAVGDPLEALKSVLEAFRNGPKETGLPMSAGLMGYLAYDLKDVIEKLPRTALDRYGLPHICLFAPSILLVRDLESGSTRLAILQRQGAESPAELKRWFLDAIESEAPEPASAAFACCTEGFRSNFERNDYMTAVARIREYIADGHVYQVNMSQKFETEFTGDPFALFQTLYRRNPAPFFAFINAGDHQIVSTSPERFLLREGERVETRPIKGTRPRSMDPAEDRRLREELLTSPKDDAELSMIVDLLRNDIGKVCAAASVRVAEHKRIEAYENVYHLVSVVEGRLAGGFDSVDLIRAAFPGGSITGCPKIRSMEIIDELEPDLRHIYTGSIGYIGFQDTLDLSIAIRTATIHDGRICFSVGGGIVYDSDPAAEYEETLHKGRTLLGVFEGRETCAATEPIVWINGRLIGAGRAMVPVFDEGVLYGNGLFETIRVDHGRPLRLTAHIDRFRQSWNVFFSPAPFPDLTWDAILSLVVERNGLDDCLAAVRLAATRGNPESPRLLPSLWATARPYRHRLEIIGRRGLRVATYPEPRETPLAGHKTANYLYYLQANRWAKAHGADEALILNPDGSVSETATANLLIVDRQRVIRPRSAHVLPGVMEAAACRALGEMGFAIERRTVRPEELANAGQMLATNALMGAVPILEVDGRPLADGTDLAARLNRLLLRC
ncbi:MAG: aminodeoxychorismate synthase component I [Desulfobacterales bacterium]